MDFDNEADRPMRDDIRLLGRLLGDTVRDQEGSDAFEVVESVRQSSIAFRRDDDVEARRKLEQMLDALSRKQTMVVVRAFSYFSHLANLAEDLHSGRRARQSDIAAEPPAEGSFVRALDRIEAAGIGPEALAAFVRDGLVVPVLTAHPTEVQRKSVRDLEMWLERLLQARERERLTPQELAENEEASRRAVLALWQTRMLRLEKLGVLDEVANGLSFFEQTFLRELPRLYGALEDELQRRHPGEVDSRGAIVLADRLVDRRRSRRQSVRHGGHPRTHAAHALLARVRILPGATAFARRRTVAVDADHRRHGRTERAGRSLARTRARIAAMNRIVERSPACMRGLRRQHARWTSTSRCDTQSATPRHMPMPVSSRPSSTSSIARSQPTTRP